VNAWVCEALPFPGVKFLSPEDLTGAPGITCTLQDVSQQNGFTRVDGKAVLDVLELLLKL
jgi:hypothetical protein